MNYFSNKKAQSKLLQNKHNELRKCQHGGLLAILAHFTASDEPAIVSLPTGAGKTELMFSISFSLKPNRILIIEPSQLLRSQTAERLRELKLFREKGILIADAPQPRICEVESTMKTLEDWKALYNYDAVVATPKTVSPEERLVCSPPDDLFDLVFIDEAHHTAAKTWRILVGEFTHSRTILLTATAFRRDRRRLPGRLAYHYPIGRALEDDIYRPVEYLPVNASDEEIARATVKKFQEEQRINSDAALMIRTDRIAKCENLRQLYSRLGVEAVVINSEIHTKTAKERLEQLRSGDVRAVITVSMMAEGIDIPGLKIASLHAPPRSLPYTLQLVGRVSRSPANQTGSAWLIASPQQVRGEARRLFREDRSWKKLIPRLVEDAIRDAHGDRADIILQDSRSSALLPEILTPFFSVEIRKFRDGIGKIHDERLPLNPDHVKRLPRDVESIEVLPEVDEGCVVVITTSTSIPQWGKDSGLTDIRNDLHVLYSPLTTGMLFTATTSPIVMKALMGALVDETEEIDPRNLQGVLSDAKHYRVVGLENALGLTGNHPSYRVHLGSGAASSVRPSDGSIYGPGHVLGQMLNDELRGIAVRNRRVWAMKRKPMREFTAWCRELAGQLIVPGTGLPELKFLAQPVPASELFTEKPIGIVVAEHHFHLPISSLVQLGEPDLEADQHPILDCVSMQDGVMKATLTFQEKLDPIRLSYQASLGSKHWVLEDMRKFEIVDPLSGERQDLEDFLNVHAPIMLMPNGGAVMGDYGWKLLDKDAVLPDEMFEKIDWADTDITKEAKEAENGKKNVHGKTLEKLKSDLPDDAIVILDDGAYEIADYIVIEPNQKYVMFIHCKFSKETKPGNRVLDWYELFSQCTRSHAWIRRENLLLELDQRIDGRSKTKIISGMGVREDLRIQASDYKANEWKFQVLAVQPGCDINKLLSEKKSHVYRGIGVVLEWLLQAGAKFSILGS